MDTNSIIAKLVERRNMLGVTQRHLAELSGVSEISVKKIESGRANPTINTLAKLADVLGMEIKVEVKKVQL